MKSTLAFVLLSVFLNCTQARSDPPEAFPLLEGEALTGKSVSLPQDFQVKTAWIIIGFTKDSQKATSSCAEKLEVLFKNQGYSIAVIQGAPFFIKGIIKKSIRASVPETRRERYFILSEGRDKLQLLAGFEEKSKDEAYILGVRFRSPREYVLVFKNHGSCEDQTHLSLVTKSIQDLIHGG